MINCTILPIVLICIFMYFFINLAIFMCCLPDNENSGDIPPFTKFMLLALPSLFVPSLRRYL